MRDVFGLGVRWFGGAAFVVAAFWLFHPSMEAACRHFGPGVCFQSVWAPAKAKSEPPSIANPSEAVSFDKALDDIRASRKAGDFAATLDRLDAFGRALLRHYEAEEAKGATRRVRYWFLHGDLEARKLSTEAALRGEAQMAAKASQYAQIFASLASVESIDLVLREAKLRAPNDLTGALLSPTLREAIKAFWQDLAPIPVFYATNRARIGDEDGAFDDLAGEVEAISWGLATVSAPVYASPVFAAWQREEAEAAIDAGASQTVAVRTIKSLDPEGFDALLSARAGEQGLIYVHGRQTPFEIAAIRAAELASALRIEGPVMVLSWAAGRPCDDPHIAKLVFAGWKKLASAPSGRPPILVAHGEGACASQAPFTAAQGLAPSELPLTRAIMLDPQWAAGGQDGGPRPLTQYLPARAQA
ncbi:MAG TPA: hypothetical protein DCL54_04725, partial [Alphaproteobacteria bacterium]|nr:hypothetical protein [Alphaproteobacteria bacterium]